MDAPPLTKGTTAEVALVPQLDQDGALVVIVIIKERFALDRRRRLHRAGGATVYMTDEPWDPDAPETSSIRYPSDVCLRKPSTDVIVVGSAITPRRQPRTELDVLVRVGPMERMLRVFGMRVWYKGLVGLTLSRPEPFEEVPLKWELAWGGSDFEDPKHPLEEPRNPLGRGVLRDPTKLVHQPGPQIEDPRNLIDSTRTRPHPAGVGAIGRHWVPRRNYLGTMDAHWLEERMPLLPLDFDDRFYQVAPPELIAPAPLRGGERVELLHLHEDGPLVFEIPTLHFFVGAQLADRMVEYPKRLDTVVIEPNQRTIDLTWRAIVPLPRQAGALRHVQVHEKRAIA